VPQTTFTLRATAGAVGSFHGHSKSKNGNIAMHLLGDLGMYKKLFDNEKNSSVYNVVGLGAFTAHQRYPKALYA
jgi:hypothetical protein